MPVGYFYFVLCYYWRAAYIFYWFFFSSSSMENLTIGNPVKMKSTVFNKKLRTIFRLSSHTPVIEFAMSEHWKNKQHFEKNWADYVLLNNGNKLTLIIFINYFILNEQRLRLNMNSIVCDLMRIWSLLLTTIKYKLIWIYLKLSKCLFHVCHWKASIKANPSNQYLKWQSINFFEQISAPASTWNLSQKC